VAVERRRGLEFGEQGEGWVEMVEKTKSESSLVARRGAQFLLGPVKKNSAKKASSSVAKRRSSISSPANLTGAKRRSSLSSPANPTEFKGVRMRAWGKWVTEIRDPDTKERIWLGSFATAEMAARAYDAGMVCLKGESVYASLNFPNSPPRIPNLSNAMSPKDIQAAAAAAAISSVPAAKPLCIPPTQCFVEDESERSSLTSWNCGSQDFNQSSACSVSEATSSADEVSAIEDWIDAAIGDLNPPQESNDFLQEMMKQADMVDAMRDYYFEQQPAFYRTPEPMESDNMLNELADLWCLL